VRPPYPVDIVPLLPEFLERRRAKMTFHLRAMEALGLDRPAYFFVINRSYDPPDGVSAERLDSPYASIPGRWRGMAAAARGAGLVEEAGAGWRLTAKGRDVARQAHDAARAHFATLDVLAADELGKLARLLDAAFQAVARSPEPPRDHTPRAFVYRDGEPEPGSFAQLDAAVYGLWQVRDDCHMAAWRAAGIGGPDLEVLTLVWRGETNADSLAERLQGHAADDIRGSLERLRRAGRIEQGTLGVTAQGTRFRQDIEDETDRHFFAPWPDDVGAQGKWVRQKLSQVNAALV
jgi:hypothetical protein